MTIIGINGRCAVKDGLSPLLKNIEDDADAIILGSPIYFGSMTGEMRSFMERLLFAPLVYTNPPRSAFPMKIRTGIIYTMNVPEEMIAERGHALAAYLAPILFRNGTRTLKPWRSGI